MQFAMVSFVCLMDIGHHKALMVTSIYFSVPEVIVVLHNPPLASVLIPVREGVRVFFVEDVKSVICRAF